MWTLDSRGLDGHPGGADRAALPGQRRAGAIYIFHVGSASAGRPGAAADHRWAAKRRATRSAPRPTCSRRSASARSGSCTLKPRDCDHHRLLRPGRYAVASAEDAAARSRCAARRCVRSRRWSSAGATSMTDGRRMLGRDIRLMVEEETSRAFHGDCIDPDYPDICRRVAEDARHGADAGAGGRALGGVEPGRAVPRPRAVPGRAGHAGRAGEAGLPARRRSRTAATAARSSGTRCASSGSTRCSRRSSSHATSAT